MFSGAISLDRQAAVVDVRVKLEIAVDGEVVASVTCPLLVDGGQEESFLDLGMDFWCDGNTFTVQLQQHFQGGPRKIEGLAGGRAVAVCI